MAIVFVKGELAAVRASAHGKAYREPLSEADFRLVDQRQAVRRAVVAHVGDGLHGRSNGRVQAVLVVELATTLAPRGWEAVDLNDLR